MLWVPDPDPRPRDTTCCGCGIELSDGNYGILQGQAVAVMELHNEISPDGEGLVVDRRADPPIGARGADGLDFIVYNCNCT